MLIGKRGTDFVDYVKKSPARLISQAEVYLKKGDYLSTANYLYQAGIFASNSCSCFDTEKNWRIYLKRLKSLTHKTLLEGSKLTARDVSELTQLIKEVDSALADKSSWEKKQKSPIRKKLRPLEIGAGIFALLFLVFGGFLSITGSTISFISSDTSLLIGIVFILIGAITAIFLFLNFSKLLNK